MRTETRTIVLIHGLWMTPRSWDLFRRRYEAQGFRVLAPAWPRMHGTVEDLRRDPAPLAGLGLREIADHYAERIRELETPPILIGHSMGGLIVQMLLGRGHGSAGVAIDSATPKGIYRLPWSVLKSGSPVLANPLNYWRIVGLSFKQFRYAFAHTMPEREARRAYELDAVPGPGRPLFEVALGNFSFRAANAVDFERNDRAPLLLIGGADDHLVPSALNLINYQLYRRSTATTVFKEFPHRSHLIVAQPGWEEVADYALTWAEAAAARGRSGKLLASPTPSTRPTSA
jgi:pimeloyl-ACP methyl ester carboxylesterase